MLLTNYGENALADYIRGLGITLPTSWYWAPMSAFSESSPTEVTGAGIARAAMVRSLANWSGTQSAGSTTASSGTSHSSSNNALVDCGIAPAAIADITHVGAFDLSSGGNCWFCLELAAPLNTNTSDPITFAAGTLVATLGLVGGMTDYFCNKVLDQLMRDVAYTMPANKYLTAYTAMPNNAGGGTEVGGGVGYARVAIPSDGTNWSGTQAPGSTGASSGTGGRSSNNIQQDFPAPSGSWGAVVGLGLKDASTAGNLLMYGAMASPKTVGVGNPLFVAADKLGITLN